MTDWRRFVGASGPDHDVLSARVKRIEAAGIASLVLSVFLIYGQSWNHQFLAWDDTSYVSDNARVLRGLSVDNICWAFSSFQLSNWHPLTLLSHMLDVSLWGTRAGAHVITNAAFHAANSVFVYLLLRTLLVRPVEGQAEASWMAWMAALLFAVHPLHVESVAWISERKDVLCLFFSLGALLSYCRYTANRTFPRYLAVTACLGLALLSKPMAVTVPVLMVLMDFHPAWRAPGPSSRKASLYRLAGEKLPWILMALGTGILTILAQKNAMPEFGLADRVQMATLAYGWYLWKTLWPSGLHYYYLTENALDLALSLAAAVVLFGISLAAWRWRRDHPAILIGWAWFLVTLLPVVGFVKVGTQAWADRYAYLPHVGLFLALAATMLAALRGRAARLASSALIFACIACGAVAFKQVGVWKDTRSLYSKALSEEPDHYPAIMGLSNLALSEGRHEDAAVLATRALTLSSGPGLVRAMNLVLGDVDRHRGDLEAAIEHYRIGRAADPVDALVRTRLGLALLEAGRPIDAEAPLREALALAPEDAHTGNALGVALAQTGRYGEAVTVIQTALRHAPADRNLQINLVTATFKAGDASGALLLLERYERMFPGDPRAIRIRGSLR